MCNNVKSQKLIGTLVNYLAKFSPLENIKKLINKFPNTTPYIFVEWMKHLSEYGDNGQIVMSEGLKTSFPDAELSDGSAGISELSARISENADYNKIYKMKDVIAEDLEFKK